MATKSTPSRPRPPKQPAPKVRRRKGGGAPTSPPLAPPEPAVEVAASAQSGRFEFCTAAEADRVLQLLRAAELISGTTITTGHRIAVGANLIRSGLLESVGAASPEQRERVHAFFLQAIAGLLGEALGAVVRVDPPPPPEAPGIS